MAKKYRIELPPYREAKKWRHWDNGLLEYDGKMLKYVRPDSDGDVMFREAPYSFNPEWCIPVEEEWMNKHQIMRFCQEMMPLVEIDGNGTDFYWMYSYTSSIEDYTFHLENGESGKFTMENYERYMK